MVTAVLGYPRCGSASGRLGRSAAVSVPALSAAVRGWLDLTTGFRAPRTAAGTVLNLLGKMPKQMGELGGLLLSHRPPDGGGAAAVFVGGRRCLARGAHKRFPARFFYFPEAIDFCSVAVREQEAYKMILLPRLEMEFQTPAVFLLVSPLPSPAERCWSQRVVIGLWRSSACWYRLKPNGFAAVPAPSGSPRGRSWAAAAAAGLTGSAWLISSCN